MTHPEARGYAIRGRACATCAGPIPEWKRPDAIHCSYMCKQRRHNHANKERQRKASRP